MSTPLVDIAERLAAFRAQLTQFDGEYQSVETTLLPMLDGIRADIVVEVFGVDRDLALMAIRESRK